MVHCTQNSIFLGFFCSLYVSFQEIAEKFLSGNLKIEEFLDQFISRRKTMHLRKAKAEKMLELVSRQLSLKGSSLGQQAASRISVVSQNNNHFQVPNYSNAPVTVPYSSNNTPYPLGPVNMPMPNNYTPNHF